jgi:hypothetical protein
VRGTRRPMVVFAALLVLTALPLGLPAAFADTGGYRITSFAGGGARPGDVVHAQRPVNGIAVDAAGGVFLSHGTTLTRVDPVRGDESVVAGTGQPRTSPVGTQDGDGGTARDARIAAGTVVADALGGLVIDDASIRYVARATCNCYGKTVAAGHIDTLAGGGSGRTSGDRATALNLSGPLALDAMGNLIVGHAGGLWIVPRQTGTSYGRTMTAGRAYVLAGMLGQIDAVAVDAFGNVVWSNDSDLRLRAYPARSGTYYGVAMTARHVAVIASRGTDQLMPTNDGDLALHATLRGPLLADPFGNLLAQDRDGVDLLAGASGTARGRSVTAGHVYAVVRGGPNATGADSANVPTTAPYLGAGGPALSAASVAVPVLHGPLALDAEGDVLLAEPRGFVLLIASTTGYRYGRPVVAGQLTALAGSAGELFSGDSGAATDAVLGEVGDVSVDPFGDLIVPTHQAGRVLVTAESVERRYQRWLVPGEITTVAGNGFLGSTDGGLANEVLLRPDATAVSPSGDVVISSNGRLMLLAETPAANHFSAGLAAGQVQALTGTGSTQVSGVPSTSSAVIRPYGLGFTRRGDLLVTNGDRISLLIDTPGVVDGADRKSGYLYDLAGPLTTNQDEALQGVGLGQHPDVAEDLAGNVLIADGIDRLLLYATSDGVDFGRSVTSGSLYTLIRGLDHPSGLAVDPAGDAIVAETGSDTVGVLPVAKGTRFGQPLVADQFTRLAGSGDRGFDGDGGPAPQARLNRPLGLSTDAGGNVLIADSENHVVRVVAASTEVAYGDALVAGEIRTVVGDGSHGFLGDGSASRAAVLSGTRRLLEDSEGNDFALADQGVRVFARVDGTSFGRTMRAGATYTVAGTGLATADTDPTIDQVNTETPATAVDLALDPSGSLVFSTLQGLYLLPRQDGTVDGRAVVAGHTYLMSDRGYGAASTTFPGLPLSAYALGASSLAIDDAGDLVLLDGGRLCFVPRQDGSYFTQDMQAGHLYLLASGLGGSLSFDANRNVLLADGDTSSVELFVSRSGADLGQDRSAGTQVRLAGNGINGFAGDDGPATDAELAQPSSVTEDTAGNLVVADTQNDRLRVLATQDGTFYDQAMTRGSIYTIAGNGTQRSSGDDGPPLQAGIPYPSSVLGQRDGGLLLSQLLDGPPIRRIAPAAAPTQPDPLQPVLAGPADPPSSIAARAGTSGLSITWSAPRQPVTGYQIGVSPDGGSTWTSADDPCTASLCRHDLAGLTPGSYLLRVTALSAYGPQTGSAPLHVRVLGSPTRTAVTLTITAPAQFAHAHPITIRGRLTDARTHAVLPAARVLLVARRSGSTQLQIVGTALSDGTGEVSLVTTPSATTTYYWTSAVTPSHLAGRSPSASARLAV